MLSKYIIGVDEVGCGSWSGKLMVCAVRASIDWKMDGLRDSKKLSKNQREILKNQLCGLSDFCKIKFSIHTSTNEDIDKYGLGVCHKTCVSKTINDLYIDGDLVIMDGNLKPEVFYKYGLREGINITTEIKADDKYPVVMAASIIAKQMRDLEMIELDKEFPGYGWNSNVGYISKEHKEAVNKFGLTKYHRKSYKVKL